MKFENIARECRNTYKGSLAGVPIVGLEHIEPYDMLLQRWDTDVETTFTKSFKKGQILFGRRRAYQHKACVATCDGICSGDITVIEPIEGMVCPELLPFIVQNDNFFDHAIKGSNGALSPRVKWEHMANYEFTLPSLEEQRVLADKLWAAYEVKQSYLNLIDATNQMVKAKFVEMLNSVSSKEYSIGEIAKVNTGSTPSRNVASYWGGNNPWVSAQDMGSKYIYDTLEKVTDEGYATCKIIPAGSVLYVCRGSIGVMSINKIDCATNQSICTATCGEKCRAEYLYYFLEQSKSNIKQLGVGTSFKSLNQSSFSALKIRVPAIEVQDGFIVIAEQAESSIAHLNASIEAIDKVIRSLINENL